MDYLPGFCQGISRVLVSYPFDYVRLYLQTNNSKSFSDFFKKNKLTSLYRGVGVPLTTVPIERAIQFKIYEQLNNYYLSPFISGSICGTVSVLFTLPSSFICNNYILKKKEQDLIKFTRTIFKNPTQLYNGFKPELLRSTLGTSIYLGTYGNMREYYGNDLHQSVINGAVSGWSVWTITYPIETLKVEQQIHNRTITYILKERISNFGILNLWKGISPIYIRTLPSSIIGMVVYEEVKKMTELK
tara:strand:- start:400 stop:1131 length:732 start_codon:yes stop_codon:yes gene_type:complete